MKPIVTPIPKKPKPKPKPKEKTLSELKGNLLRLLFGFNNRLSVFAIELHSVNFGTV